MVLAKGSKAVTRKKSPAPTDGIPKGARDEQAPPALGGGEADTKCGARTRSFPYSPCQQVKGYGTNHVGIGACRFHGGLLPNHQIHADRVRIEEGAKTLLRREDLQPVDNPLLELQKLAAEVVRFKEILGDKVEELGNWTSESIMESEEIRAIISAYERALDRTNTVLSGIVRLNIEERLAKVSEIQALMLIAVFDAVFKSKDVGMSKPQVIAARAVVAKEIPRVTRAA